MGKKQYDILKAKPGVWYLVECPMWSESGWTIAEFDGDGFLCQTCGRHVSVDIFSFRELT